MRLYTPQFYQGRLRFFTGRRADVKCGTQEIRKGIPVVCLPDFLSSTFTFAFFIACRGFRRDRGFSCVGFFHHAATIAEFHAPANGHPHSPDRRGVVLVRGSSAAVTPPEPRLSEVPNPKAFCGRFSGLRWKDSVRLTFRTPLQPALLLRAENSARAGWTTCECARPSAARRGFCFARRRASSIVRDLADAFQFRDLRPVEPEHQVNPGGVGRAAARLTRQQFGQPAPEREPLGERAALREVRREQPAHDVPLKFIGGGDHARRHPLRGDLRHRGIRRQPFRHPCARGAAPPPPAPAARRGPSRPTRPRRPRRRSSGRRTRDGLKLPRHELLLQDAQSRAASRAGNFSAALARARSGRLPPRARSGDRASVPAAALVGRGPRRHVREFAENFNAEARMGGPRNTRITRKNSTSHGRRGLDCRTLIARIMNPLHPNSVSSV